MILLSISIPLLSLVDDYPLLIKTKKITLKDQLSPNRLVKFRKCPKNFQYRQLEYPRKVADTTAMDFGKMLHLIQERFYQNIPIHPTHQEIIDEAQSCLEHEWLPRFQSKQRTAKTAVANFILFEKWRLDTASEDNIPYKVEDDEENVIDPIIETDVYSDMFHAIVDFYWRAHSMLIDWKFGKSNTVYDGYKVQLSVERHVLEFNEMPVKVASLGFLRKSTQPTRVSTYPITMLKEMRDRLVSAVESNFFIRKEGPLCWYCEDFIRCYAEKNGFSLWSGILK